MTTKNQTGAENDYSERLHKAVMRFGAYFRSMEECREFEKDIIKIMMLVKEECGNECAGNICRGCEIKDKYLERVGKNYV